MASGSAVSDPSLNGVSSTPGENEYPSGFPQSICDEVPKEKYLCSNCNNVLNKAHQTVCGHRYCLACVNWLVRNNKDLVCTKCKEEDPSVENDTSVLTLDQFFNDAAINKEILDLKVHCANQGCPWRSTLKNFEEHQSQCEHALIPCNIGCGIMVQRKTLATHLERGCPNNKNTCPSCSAVLTPRELQKHVCPNSVDKKTLKTEKRQKNNPQSNSKKKEPCIFSEVGCPFKGNSDKVKEHESCSHVGHLQLLLEVTRTLQRTFHSQPEGGHHEIALDYLHPGQNGASLASQSEGEIEADGGDPGMTDKAFSLHDDQAELAVGQQLDALQQRVQIMENIISALNQEVEKTQLSVVALDRDNQNNQQIILHLETKVAELHQRLVRKDMCIASLQQSISIQEDVSYDGTFLWRLCDVSQRLREAATGQKISQYSPAFYTTRYGFKVCMRLYLNGDGVGKGTHISLFFVIMKGDYDPILTWPFRHKVTFFLIDQNHREHVIDAFRPDLSSASFHRPVSEMNVASGCPLFFPLGKLRSPKHAYCKDDTIYIKCVVDTS
ncbi:TNF receptor-associated factor 1-like [Myxocyprinus asiaticus]|uniref:TNF receptor-associated factor 1-like n=1 Tax=Myxocyprinus asiaticus TaxID=70543 RepID=UPI0022213EBC|nr:TNF receptor-associated factor 1-like [Myxocyprinus asiaticus]XP_051509714.1 TNF receptor-associated factor 1-like [Myxocyprinus asiaticus]XP_051509715.1 TNF receptor-associated factor 1-like [Myxocyprinus asiaticus]